MTGYDQDKVFAPTPRKRRQAREQGQVVVSPELVAGMLLLSLTGVLHMFGDRLLDDSGTFLRGSLEQVRMEAFDSREELTTHFVGQMGRSAGYFLVRLWPFWILMIVAAVSVLVQTRGLIHWAALSPSMTRINPAVGIQRFSLGNLAGRFIGTSLKIAGLSSIAWFWVSRQHEIRAQLDLAHQTQAEIHQAVLFLFTLSGGLLVWGVLDYVFKRRRFEKQLQMTASELADEQKQFDPDPAVGRRAQEMRSRMTVAVSLNRHTDLLITNGLTDCVLLRFDPQIHSMPEVVVRQSDAAGVQLLQRCMNSGVRIHESKDLLQELSHAPEQSIPERLWPQIAELCSRRETEINSQNLPSEPVVPEGVSS